MKWTCLDWSPSAAPIPYGRNDGRNDTLSDSRYGSRLLVLDHEMATHGYTGLHMSSPASRD